MSLYQAMAPGQVTDGEAKKRCWAAIMVRRPGEELEELGSLHNLRQRLNRFQVEMAGWAEVERERAARRA